MIDDGDLEIFAAFVEEGDEMMDDVEPQLVELEQSSSDSGMVDLETINSIFRLFHSMKGSAGFLELNCIVKLTHKAENLLDIFRKEEAALGGSDVTLLLQTIDLLRKTMADLVESGQDNTYKDEVNDLVDLLQGSIESKKNPGSAPAEQAVAEDAAAVEALEEPFAQESEPESDSSDIEFPKINITEEMHAKYMEEAEELLDSSEQDLLQALNGEEETVDLAEALRCLHSFKGNSGFMGYSHLEKLTHKTETTLEKVVEGEIKADEEALTIFLNVVDALRKGVADLAGDNGCDVEALEVLQKELDAFIESTIGSGSADSEPAEEAAPVVKSGFIPLGGMKKPKKVVAPVEVAKADPEPITTPVAPAPAPAPAPVAEKPEAPKPPAAKPAAAKMAKGKGTKAATAAPARKASGSIRVDLSKLDSLMNLVGELVIAEAMVTRNPDLDGHEFENLEKSSHHLRRITSDLQDVAMSVRMVPLAGTFKKMVRLVHDTALKAGKKVTLNLKGEDTEVDKTVIEMISDPLVHIVRNAIDHGLENPEERAETEKSDSGTVTIEARHESGEVWIIVSDDGKGMDRDIILNKAIDKGLVDGDGSDLRDEDVYKMVFEPGFSTAAAVTEISGRGVGMDVVKKNIEKINGRVDIKSTMGTGSQFKMRIPLTMAIIEGMLVRVGKSTYNIPLLSIREAFRPLDSQVTTTPDGVEVVKLRDDMIPVVRMHNMYGIEPSFDQLDEGILVIVENDGVSAALFVDEILGQQQTVVKGLSDYVGSPHGVSGCTILGDGRISLILDVASILANTATAPVAVV
ncbi:MAG: chemotaxis protein CheA [bacterium]|nr:chemotaxis protein CheA [bacterium]